MLKRTDLKLRSEHLAIHSLSSFVEHNSSSRGVMFASHLSQSIVTEGCNEKLIVTGAEKELGKYTMAVKFPANVRIVKILPRYKVTLDAGSLPSNPEIYVIYEDIDTLEIGYVSVPSYKSLHTYFGFKLKANPDVMETLRVGMEYEKDSILMDSVSKGENGSYNFGTSLNTAFMSHPAISEDGIVVSESAVKALSFRVFDKRVVEFDRDEIPLNIYGDIDVYKIFPEIGERVHSDGVVMATRALNNTSNYDYSDSKDGEIEDTAVKMSVHDTMAFNPMYDNVTYARSSEGVVLDVKVHYNPSAAKGTYPHMTAQADRYASAWIDFNKSLVDFDRKIRGTSKSKMGVDTIVYTPALHTLMTEAYVINGKNTSKVKRERHIRYTYRKRNVKEYRVELVIETLITPTVGFKLTDMHGGKGVIVSVLKDDAMPVDKYGVRADIIMDSGATVSRMNIGRLYEHYYANVSISGRRQITEMLQVNDTYSIDAVENHLHSLDSSLVNQAYDWLLGLFKLVSTKQYLYFSKITDLESRISYLSAVVKNNLILYYPIGNKEEPIEDIRTIESSPYQPVRSTVSYKRDDGQTVETVEKVRIAPMYILLLDKISDDWLSAASAKLQIHGLPVPVSMREKHKHPWSYTPVRILGETEGRLILNYCGRKALAEMVDRSGSIKTHKHIYRQLLESDAPSNIENLVDRTKIPYGENKALSIFNHVARCSGWTSVYVPEETKGNSM